MKGFPQFIGRKLPGNRVVFALLLKATLVLSGMSIAADSLAAELKEDPNLPYVVAHCTACHSSALITQNRMTREGWLNTIRWMQKKQGLWPLGEHESLVLDYLEKHYYPQDTGRRKPLPEHLMPR